MFIVHKNYLSDCQVRPTTWMYLHRTLISLYFSLLLRLVMCFLSSSSFKRVVYFSSPYTGFYMTVSLGKLYALSKLRIATYTPTSETRDQSITTPHSICNLYCVDKDLPLFVDLITYINLRTHAHVFKNLVTSLLPTDVLKLTCKYLWFSAFTLVSVHTQVHTWVSLTCGKHCNIPLTSNNLFTVIIPVIFTLSSPTIDILYTLVRVQDDLHWRIRNKWYVNSSKAC